MYFYISKILGFLIDPFIWILAGLLIGILSKSQKKSKWFLSISIIILTILSVPLLSNWAVSKWEEPPILKENLPLCDVGIVLTGMTHVGRLPKDQIHFAESVDRITEAIVLYKDGLIGQIIVSGGSATILNTDENESLQLRDFILGCKVKEKDLHLEQESRNTYENAFYSAHLLNKLNLQDRKILLITSAFHMPRALRCFKKQGIEVIPYSVDYRAQRIKWDPSMIIPSIESLQIWQTLLKEWMGLLIYRLVGYA
ncbi:MAG: uncharacterized SAM-binding protein YcdF (DUF218 family) [Cyclobacteriaceae bacterium]